MSALPADAFPTTSQQDINSRRWADGRTALLFSGLVWCALLHLFPASALAEDQVTYAGIAFLGSYAEVPTKFPYLHAIVEEDGSDGSVATRLYELTNSTESSFLNIETTRYADIAVGESVVMALVIDREVVSQERFGDKVKLLINVGAQVMYFDFASRILIGSFPLDVSYIDISDRTFSHEEIDSSMADLLYGEQEDSVFHLYAEHLRTARLPRAHGNRLGVVRVGVSPEAVRKLPSSYQEDLGAAKDYIAGRFARSISEAQSIAIVPYVAGHAIGNQMAARFSDRSVMNFEIPQPDYQVGIDVLDFRRVKYSETAAGTAWIYGAYVGVNVVEPLSGRVFADLNLKNGATKVVPSNQTLVDDWPAFDESLLALFSKFASAVGSPEKKWAALHTGDAGNLGQLVALNEVVERCR